MPGRDPCPQSPAHRGKVVPFRAPRPHVRGLWLHKAELTGDVPALLVVTDDDRAYLFPEDILSLAGDLLSADPASLVQAGAGLDITMLFDTGRTAGLRQAVAICRARQ
jgi:hypothetical protein